jgi:transcriptional regulator with XRE-family HTH domain
MSDPLRLRPFGEHAALVWERLTALSGAELVDDPDRAELIVMTPEDLAELIEDAAATAAYQRTRDQEYVPISIVDRLIAHENPVRVWREHRGHSLRQLAERAGVGIGYLSQIENGERKGTVETLKKTAAALVVDLDDLTWARSMRQLSAGCLAWKLQGNDRDSSERIEREDIGAARDDQVAMTADTQLQEFVVFRITTGRDALDDRDQFGWGQHSTRLTQKAADPHPFAN